MSVSRREFPAAWAISVIAAGLFAAPIAGAANTLEPVPGAHVKGVEASSQSPDMDPSSVTDGRLGTAWVSDAGASVGETIVVSFTTTRYLTRIDVLPGVGRDNTSFKRHARPARIRVAWEGGEQVFELHDRRKAQPLEFAGLARTSELRVTVEAVHGSTKHGVAISEIVGYEPHDILEVAPALRDKIEGDVAKLGDPDEGDRAMARVISYGRPVVPWLVDHVTRGDARTSSPALTALLELDAPQAQRIMRDALIQGTPAQVAVVLRALSEAGAVGLESALLEAAQRFRGELAIAALDGLASTADRRALPLLTDALNSGDPQRMAVASSRLSGFDKAGRAVASAALDSDTESVRLSSIAALGGFVEDPAAVAAVAPLARHASPITRSASIAALGRMSGSHARAALGELLAEVSGSDRGHALAALVAHDDDAIPMLEALLDRDAPELHSEIMDHMAAAQTPGVRSLLVRAVLSVDPPAWQRHAVRALASHGHGGTAALLDELRAYPTSASRAAGFLRRVASSAARPASQMLKDLGPDREYDDLRSVLVSTVQTAGYENGTGAVIDLYRSVTTSDRLRREALTALGHLPTQASRDLVLVEMDHPDPQLARLALQASSRLRDVRAIPKVLARLEGRHVRDWQPDAVEALGALRADGAVPLFQDRMSYATRGIQLAILRACHRIGGRDALRILVDASISDDMTVARTAHQLLRRVD